MPYRRLPNTDAARLKALKTAYKKGKEIPPFKLSFTQVTYQRIQSFLSRYETKILQHKKGFTYQVEKQKDYQKEFKKAKLYISHFIQVMNMAIARGELANKVRTFFNLDEDDKRLPSLNSESDIIHWGEILIKGEEKRKMAGQSPITNPTIAVVKVRFENFMDSYNFQKTLQKSNQRMLDELSELRNEADDIILNTWNEVENTYADLSDEEKRTKSAEYGVSYVYRRNELKSLNIENQVKIVIEN